MKIDQETFEHVRSLQGEIRKLEQAPSKSPSQFEELKSKRLGVIELCKDFEEAPILLKDKAYRKLLGPFPETKKKLLPCSPGVSWDQCHLTLISDEAVRIRTPDGEERYTYPELELSDKRKGDQPKKLWYYLEVFARLQGSVTLEDGRQKVKGDFFKYMQKLDKHLQKLFGIEQSIYEGTYKKFKAYKSTMIFSDQTQVAENPFSEEKDEVTQEFQEEQERYSPHM